jgi:NAD kinase
MNVEYAIIVKNKTRLEVLIERFNTKAQAKFYIERSGGNFEDYEVEDRIFHESLSLIQRQLSKVIKNKIIERAYVPSFIFSKDQVVIVVGQDGLVANTAKYVNEIPIVAVNPDTARYDGYLLPFDKHNFIRGVRDVISGGYKFRSVTLAEAVLNDKQRLLAFNDLFIGASTHISARYQISFGASSEQQSSSGIIVSTKAGSTGWLSSIFNMTAGMHNFVTHHDEKKRTLRLKDDQLMFVVREPFESKVTQAGLMAGIITGKSKLVVESLMPTKGVIFSDGIETDFLNFNSGSIATIRSAKEHAKLVIAVSK